MTSQEMVRIAEPYNSRVSDALRRACGVPMRKEWTPYTLIREEDLQDYQERLRRTYG